jgi:hypothetical protein
MARSAGWAGQKEIAATASWLTSPEASLITGADIAVSGWASGSRQASASNHQRRTVCTSAVRSWSRHDVKYASWTLRRSVMVKGSNRVSAVRRSTWRVAWLAVRAGGSWGAERCWRPLVTADESCCELACWLFRASEATWETGWFGMVRRRSTVRIRKGGSGQAMGCFRTLNRVPTGSERHLSVTPRSAGNLAGVGPGCALTCVLWSSAAHPRAGTSWNPSPA